MIDRRKGAIRFEPVLDFRALTPAARRWLGIARRHPSALRTQGFGAIWNLVQFRCAAEEFRCLFPGDWIGLPSDSKMTARDGPRPQHVYPRPNRQRLLKLIDRFSQASALPDSHAPREAESQRLTSHRLVKWRAAIEERVTEAGDLDAIVNESGLEERARETPDVDPVPEDVWVRFAFALSQPDAETKLAYFSIDLAASIVNGSAFVAGEHPENRQIVFRGRRRPEVMPGPLK